MKIDVTSGLNFFLSHMHAPLQAKRVVYEQRNIRLGSAVTPSDWEVLASLLVNRKGNGGVSGIDLRGMEVKSAMNHGGYEYQYHKDTGKKKLAHDMKVSHLFFDHSDFLNEVTVRVMTGKALAKKFFQTWANNYPSPYPQRYRCAIPFSYVKEHGKVVLVIKNGKVVFHS